MSLEDDSDNLQQSMQSQPLATTSTNSGDFVFKSIYTFTTGMFKIIMLSFTYDICVYICLISQIMKIDYLILYKTINYVYYNFILTLAKRWHVAKHVTWIYLA